MFYTFTAYYDLAMFTLSISGYFPLLTQRCVLLVWHIELVALSLAIFDVVNTERIIEAPSFYLLISSPDRHNILAALNIENVFKHLERSLELRLCNFVRD